MTFLLPQTEALGFTSDDINSSNSLHDAFFDESKQFNDYDEFTNDFLGFPLSPTLPDYDDLTGQSYEIVPDSNLKQEREGLRLKLRVSNSVSLPGPGSSGSSPHDLPDDTEIFNVEEFLNFPSNNDFVTIEESKQVAPSPAYSLSSYSTDPSPLHSSFSPGPSSSSDTCSSNSSQIPSQPGAPAQVGLTSVSQALSGAGAVPIPGVPVKIGDVGGSGGVVETTHVVESDVVVHSSSGKSYRYPSNIVPSKSVPGSSGKTNLRRHTASGSGSAGSRDVNIVPSKSLPGSGPQSAAAAGNVTKRKISESSVSSSPKAHRKTGSQVCRVIPIAKVAPENVKEKEVTETVTVKPNKNVLKKYYEQADILIKNREKEIIEVEKKESVSKLKQGAVIGSMERGPRMFGVRYGPCDRPSFDGEELVTEVKPVYDVANRYKNNPNPEADTSHGSQMVLNQQLKLNANSHSPKLPSRSFYVNQNVKTSPDLTSKRAVCDTPAKQWSCPVPKAKIELPPYRPNRLTLKDGKCRRKEKDGNSVIDMLYQKHLYCSVEKPLFESDPEILKASETYQMLLNTYVSLEAQRATALRDIDKIGNLKHAATKRPYKFIKQLKKGEIVFPTRQRIVKIPEVKLTHRNKELNLCHFKTPSGHMVAKASEEFAKSTRLKKEPY
ncbi:uncharacterized protein LOC134817754 isoform X2 [Bolinopsis microptera]|uniref:uncharacterized protein LOC134817754 isoform X2 n=1 Tax=Bolinopsis microptera TaxID=2820187 RepID=UPI00307A9414